MVKLKSKNEISLFQIINCYKQCRYWYDMFPCAKKCSKYFVSYKNGKKISPVYVFLPYFQKNLIMLRPCLFRLKMKKYWTNSIRRESKSKVLHQKNFNGNPLLNHKYLKTKIKSYKGRVTTNFNSKVAKKRSE